MNIGIFALISGVAIVMLVVVIWVIDDIQGRKKNEKRTRKQRGGD